MTDPYIGQIQAFAFSFPPKGWAFCNGQLMNINQNQALFSLIGTTFGGDGRLTFGLPNLQGRVPLGVGQSYPIAQAAGEVTHTLVASEMPLHNHPMVGASTFEAVSMSPSGAYPSQNSGTALFAPGGDTTLGNGSAPAGNSQPHPNMPPLLVMTFCIALQGLFPTRN